MDRNCFVRFYRHPHVQDRPDRRAFIMRQMRSLHQMADRVRHGSGECCTLSLHFQGLNRMREEFLDDLSHNPEDYNGLYWTFNQMYGFIKRTVEFPHENRERGRDYLQNNERVSPDRYFPFDSDANPYLGCSCDTTHEYLSDCNAFILLYPTQRYMVVKRYGGCTRCLGVNHKRDDCGREVRCFMCQHHHHTLLHFDMGDNFFNITNPRRSHEARDHPY